MNFVTIHEEYKHKFFQLPKVFFTNEKYKNMSNNAKVAWSLLRDRASLSRKNGWFDKDTGRIYFIYKNDDLMEILNIKSKTTLNNVKKELEEKELIQSKRVGLNRPNKMYLLYPIVTEDDIYKIDELENYEYKQSKSKTEKNQKDHQSLATQGRTDNGRPKNGHQDVQKMDSSNTEYSKTDYNKDTIDTHDAFGKNHSKKQKQKIMNEAFFANTARVPRIFANTLAALCKTTREADMYYKSILIAKKKASEDLNLLILFEEHPEMLSEINNTLARVIKKHEREKSIKDPYAYLYSAVYRVIVGMLDINTVNHERSIEKRKYIHSSKNSVYFDWLNE